MSDSLRFTVPGPPVPKGRPRVGRSRRGGRVVFTPERTRRYEQSVGWAALEAVRSSGWPLATPDPVRVELLVVFPDRRPRDLDNVCKAILDGAQGVAFANDSQVATLTVSRAVDRDAPRVEVVVTSLSSEFRR